MFEITDLFAGDYEAPGVYPAVNATLTPNSKAQANPGPGPGYVTVAPGGEDMESDWEEEDAEWEVIKPEPQSEVEEDILASSHL
ncbi:hypothetical protein Q8F55_003247 [Vanrija albida]|uniref:Uncharacterized protein n=1 Tax=Vanrija albida TaxID=181172 RepID=A0ABR3QC00_9TREE